MVMPAGLEPALSDRKSDVLAARRRHHIVSGGAYRIRTGNLYTAGRYVAITPMLHVVIPAGFEPACPD